VEIDLLEELRHSVEISLPEGLTLHQKVVYETLPEYFNFCHVLGHTRILCSKATATTNNVPCPQPPAQAVLAAKGTVFGRLGPQPPLQVPPPMVQGQSQDHNIPAASVENAGPEAVLENSNGWVTVDSRKSSKQRKGKAVVVSTPVLADISPTSPCPPGCTGPIQHSSSTDPLVATPCVGEVRGSSPTRTAPLVVHSCVVEAHNSSPSRTTTLATTTGDTVVVGNSMNVPLPDVAA
jgi:hypothetical protein